MVAQRRKDRLVGAAVALGVVALLVVAGVVALALWISDPAGDPADAPVTSGPDADADTGTDAGTDAGGAAPAPQDLTAGETWLGDLVLDAGTVVTTDATLRDVEATGTDVRSTPDGTVAGRLDVDATVPFDVVAREVGNGAQVRAAEDGLAEVETEVELLGRSFPVVATGSVEVVEGRLVVLPRAIDIGGSQFVADVAGGVARELVTIEQDVEGLPEGLVLQDVAVQDDGFRVTLTGTDVALG